MVECSLMVDQEVVEELDLYKVLLRDDVLVDFRLQALILRLVFVLSLFLQFSFLGALLKVGVFDAH